MAWNMDADLKKVGQNLQKARIARNLPIDTVARDIKQTPELLERLEAGKCPECTLNILFDLAEYYGISAEEILGK